MIVTETRECMPHRNRETKIDGTEIETEKETDKGALIKVGFDAHCHMSVKFVIYFFLIKIRIFFLSETHLHLMLFYFKL